MATHGLGAFLQPMPGNGGQGFGSRCSGLSGGKCGAMEEGGTDRPEQDKAKRVHDRMSVAQRFIRQ